MALTEDDKLLLDAIIQRIEAIETKLWIKAVVDTTSLEEKLLQE